MRHSTLELTGRYTRPRMHDIEGASDSLPSLRPTPDRPEAMAATGTEGASHRKTLAPHLPHAGDGSRRILSETGRETETQNPPSIGHNPLEIQGIDASGRGLSVSDASAPRRTRTYNPLIKSQLLCQLS